MVNAVLDPGAGRRMFFGHSFHVMSAVFLVQRRAYGSEERPCPVCNRRRPCIILQKTFGDPAKAGSGLAATRAIADSARGKACIWFQCAITPEEIEVARALEMTKLGDSDCFYLCQ